MLLQEKTLRYKRHYKWLADNIPDRKKFIEKFSEKLASYPPMPEDISLLKVVVIGKETGSPKKIKIEKSLAVKSDQNFTSM